MINFSHQSENDIKIIFWERFKGKSIGKFKNTYFTDSFEDFIAFSNQIIHKHPTRSVELHFNIHLFTQFYNMQNSLNNTRIKKVHFYEDASNYIWYTPVHEWMFFDLPNAKTFLHIWGDETKLCSSQKPASQCEWVKKMKQYISFLPVDFEKISQDLTPKQKKIIFNLAGFDYQKYKKLLSNKPNGIYLLGSVWQTDFQGGQLAALKESCEKTPGYKWFYKPHPTKIHQPTHKTLNHLCPGILPLDEFIPYELFLIGHLKPNKVSGFSSSIFANLKKEDILFYIQRHFLDGHIQSLFNMGIIDDENYYTMPKIIQAFKDIGLIQVFYAPKEKESLHQKNWWFLKINETKMCNILNDTCAIISKKSKNKMTLFYKNTTFKIHRLNEYQFKTENELPFGWE